MLISSACHFKVSFWKEEIVVVGRLGVKDGVLLKSEVWDGVFNHEAYWFWCVLRSCPSLGF